MPWLDALLRKMVEIDASDLHVSSGVQPQFRLHGDMTPIEGLPVVEAEQMTVYLKEIAPKRRWMEFQEEWDSDFAYELAGIGRFRVNLFMDHKGSGGVFRLIPEKIPTASDLGLPAAALSLTHHSKGLVLVTGPTGSGKSTTLAAMIGHINETRSDHIITIEDPIEFVHPNKKCLINQREVSRHTISFKKALRAALREDPDIVLVGEMRDLETIAIAIETAETGHLVFGTLHTSTAASTVDRIIDQFPADRQSQIRMMLSGSLRGVISQNLCRRVGGGRVAAQEILIANTAVSALIREGKTHQLTSCMQVGGKDGMRLLNDVLMDLVKSSTITPDEAYIKCVSKDDMASKLEASGFSVTSGESAGASSRPASTPGATRPPAAPQPPLDPVGAGVGGGNGNNGGNGKNGGGNGEGYVDPFEEFRKKRNSG